MVSVTDTAPIGPAARRVEFASLNGARAIAAYLVVATHAGFESGLSLQGSVWAPFVARANFGVTIFFLLSGFLLSRRFLIDDGTLSAEGLRGFWRRRVVRILPAYWLAIVGALALFSVRHTPPSHWAFYLLLVHPYVHMSIDPTLSQMWTLAVEISFYAILPALFWLSRRFGKDRRAQSTGLLLGLAAVALAANLLVHLGWGDSSYALLWMPLYLDWFGLGIALAALSVYQANPVGWHVVPLRWAQSTATCWAVGVVTFWLSTLPLGGPRSLVASTTWEWTFRHYLFAAAAFFFLLPLVVGRETWPDVLLGNRVMRWLGEVSYGVYLWHLGLLLALQRWLGYQVFSGHFGELFGLAALGATAVAALSWHLVERPLLRRFSQSWRRPGRREGTREHQPDTDQAERLHPDAVGQGIP
jgi:peptidoglycan/LPS O-acetylase OafA/YrhL